MVAPMANKNLIARSVEALRSVLMADENVLARSVEALRYVPMAN